jgi:hypothetical protein
MRRDKGKWGYGWTTAGNVRLLDIGKNVGEEFTKQ